MDKCARLPDLIPTSAGTDKIALGDSGVGNDRSAFWDSAHILCPAKELTQN